ncbi:MAG: hypothetical protein AB7I36_18155 [Rhodospirillaceae bacterium]
MFDIDPDKPNIPAIARILSGMGLFLLVASIVSMMLAFSGYPWVNEIYAIAGAIGAFLMALVFLAQGKIIEQLAVVSARVKSRFAIEGAMKNLQTGAPPAASPAATTAWSGPAARPKERVIHVPDEQARQSGFKVR